MRLSACAIVLFVLPPFASASFAQTPLAGQKPAQPPVPTVQETVQVVATRLPENPDTVPTSVEVITGDELRNLGARDLKGALALFAGVDIAPGGDAGPASAVPEFWGLREFDAFLLVVDGVPWGGAFNPALAALSLSDIERVEVLRGPAPVTYGATSFVGVIHVVHKSASASGGSLSGRYGSYGSGAGTFAVKVPFLAGWDSRLSAEIERQGYSDPRTSYRRVHALWRNSTPWGRGRFSFNVDAGLVDQDPASPSPRTGQTLSPLVPIDANQNPSGSFLNDHRFVAQAGFDRPAAGGTWTTTGSFSRANQDLLRGYLQSITDTPDNAIGLREQIGLTDVYVDSHLSWKPAKPITLVAGGEFLFGGGLAHGADFTYQAPLDGSFAPVVTVPSVLDVRIEDHREFGGGYLMGEWQPTAKVRVDAGVRLNIVSETRDTGDAAEQPGADAPVTRNHVRPSGSVGAMWSPWQSGNDRLGLFVNYRNTFKPAAFDFGLGEGEAEGLLNPETSGSVEGGLKARFLQGRMSAEASAFYMNFDNLVVATTVGGLPALQNAGTERFKGFEVAAGCYLPSHLTCRATYSFHDARFVDFVQEFDGVPTQLGGNRIEMSARHLASAGLIFAPPSGLAAAASFNYVGSRYLNMRNTALAPGFATVAASVGYRTRQWEVRLDAQNLGDRRDPVSESELGDAQYYRMTARRADVTFGWRF
jgi:iron complex outermembrane recepter protein